MGTKIESLTARERECLRLVARDRSIGEIARKLSISINTVNNHLKSAKHKLGTTDRFTAARRLAEHEGRSQSLASLGMAMEFRSQSEQFDRAEVGSADAVKDGFSLQGVPRSAAPFDDRLRRGELPDAHYSGPSALRVVATIVLIMAGILIVIVALPALVNSAQSLADLLKPRFH